MATPIFPAMKLINDDCLKVLPTLSDKSVDLILTDPPYGTTACKWDSIIPFKPMWKELKRIIKDNGCIALFGTEPFSSHLRLSNLGWFKYDWIWNKLYGTNFYEANKRPLNYYEIISIFYNKLPKYNKQLKKSKKQNRRNRTKNYLKAKENTIYGNLKKYIPNNKKDLFRNPSNIIEISNQSKEIHRTKRLHPTQKPIALLEYLIKTYTNENDTVLDFTMGSGSTGVACKNLSREFIGIELDKKYFNIAKNRINSILI